MSKISFRPFVPPPGSSNVGATAREHAADLVKVELIQNIFAGWKEMFDAPFKGITIDGLPIPDLFKLRAEKASTEPAIIATHHLLSLMSAEQKAKACFDIESRQWRNWQNTEIYVETHGLRLAEQPIPVRDAILAVLQASLSAKGYQKTRDVMRLNGYLGEILDREDVLGEWSFIFCLFGPPSSSEPWGWQLFGHHLCLNALFIGDQMTITPTFMGAEPTFADSGALDGLTLFEDEEKAGLALMRSFSLDQQTQALIANAAAPTPG